MSHKFLNECFIKKIKRLLIMCIYLKWNFTYKENNLIEMIVYG